MPSQPWAVEIDAGAARDIRKLGSEQQKLILRYLRTRLAQAEDPRRFGAPLLGDMNGFWRYRVGDYRIIAKIEDHRLVVLAVRVGHRREVYE